MFNTTFLNVKERGFLEDISPFVKQRFRDLFCFYFDAFELYDTDKELIETLDMVFPRHFLHKNIDEAKQVIYDLDDIAKSPVIRKELSPIRTYALFHILFSECGVEDDLRQAGQTFLDDNEMIRSVKVVLKKHKKSKTESRYIIDWFCHYRVMIEDLEDVYDGDYSSLSFLETAASIYIDSPLTFSILGANLDGIEELLPNDIRERYLQRKKEAPTMGVEKIYDFFISHASEDKDDVAIPLAKALTELGAKVWLDQFELKIGDSLRASIDKGIANSTHGIIIASPIYFKKFWTDKEYNALFSKWAQKQQEKVILPIRHNITQMEISRYSPMLADIFSLDTSKDSIQSITGELMDILKGSGHLD